MTDPADQAPSAARMYDFFLGGSHHFSTDRLAAEQVLRIAPWVRGMAQQNRAFLRRVVRFLVAEAGVAQILDLGSGIPTVGNVHEIAHAIDPTARVVYVDLDPVAVAHSRLILAGNPLVGVVRADLRDPAGVWAHPGLAAVLDQARPVAVLLVSVLPFMTDADRPAGVVTAFVDPLPPASFLAISHASADGLTSDALARVRAAQQTYTTAGQPVTLRSRAEIEGWFTGLDLVEPGVVPIGMWHPDADDDPDHDAMISYGGVGRVR